MGLLGVPGLPAGMCWHPAGPLFCSGDNPWSSWPRGCFSISKSLKGAPQKRPEVRAPSPNLPWHLCTGNQHQARAKPITRDDLWGRDGEPDTAARDLWPSNANIPILLTRGLRLFHTLTISTSLPQNILCSPGFLTPRAPGVSPALPRLDPFCHLTFPRISQAPGSPSMAAPNEC